MYIGATYMTKYVEKSANNHFQSIKLHKQVASKRNELQTKCLETLYAALERTFFPTMFLTTTIHNTSAPTIMQ
jgi:hypothetical protein